MKLTVLISALFISIASNASDSVIATKACVSFKRSVKFCTSKNNNPLVYKASVETKANSIEISSDENYEGVDSSKLFQGLERIALNGLNAKEAAHILGPVVSDINDIENGAVTKEEIILDFAKFISK